MNCYYTGCYYVMDQDLEGNGVAFYTQDGDCFAGTYANGTGAEFYQIDSKEYDSLLSEYIQRKKVA